MSKREKLSQAEKEMMLKYLKEMLKQELAKLSPEERERVLKKIRSDSWKIEVNVRLMKHKKLMSYLSMPLLPILTAYVILRTMKLRKRMSLELKKLEKNIKFLQMLSKPSQNLISPERKQKKEENSTPIV